MESRRGRRWLKVGRYGFVLAVSAWLVFKLSGIGWQDVWEARPRTPWFYVIWVGLYLQLVVAELLIYGRLWGVHVRELLPVILRKRVLNSDVVSYAGEAYFFFWAQRRLALPARRILGVIKDNAIASALGTWTAALLLLGVFLYTGQIALVDIVGNPKPIYVAGGIVLAVLATGLLIQFRRSFLSLPTRTVLKLVGVHLSRFGLLYVLQIVQWWVVVPEAPLRVWATMLVIQTITNRLPLIPAKDLVAIGAILSISGLLEASSAVIAAMLLMRSALDKGFNLLFFLLTTLRNRRVPPGDLHPTDADRPDAEPLPEELRTTYPVEP